MDNIMLDIETLDTVPSAVVLSIGAVAFDEERLGDSIHVRLDIDSQIAAGRTISASTLLWWMNQSEEARSAAFGGDMPVPLAISKLSALITSPKACIWGNSSMFDNAIVLNLMRSFPCSRPERWSYKTDRCYRTVRQEFLKHHEAIDVSPNVAHNALDDAIAQAQTLQRMWAVMRGEELPSD